MMITLLRKIRRSLIESGKVQKYLIYAIGEIALVMIGILLALQVNNWNENRKLQIKTQQNYHEILADLDRERTYANFIIHKFENQRQAYMEYLQSFQGEKMSRKTMYRKLLELNMEGFPINSNSSLIESLQNNGEIVMIPPEIRNKLINFRRHQQKIIVDEGLDNRSRMSVTEQFSLLIGAPDLEQRLEGQKELRVELQIDKNINEVILAMEAIQKWFDFSESKSIRLLKELVIEIDELEQLILQEINSD